MRNFGWFKEKIRFEMHHEIYLPAGQCWHIWHIHCIFYSHVKIKKKNRNLMSTLRYPRRARRDFRGVLDESLFLYMKFKMNKYLRNCGCCHVLQSIERGGDLLLLLFTYWRFMRPCAALRCFFLCEFEFSLYGTFYIHDSQFVLVCFIYIYVS